MANLSAQQIADILRSAVNSAREFGQDGQRVSVEILERAAELLEERGSEE